mmetsp:Transcript_30616/g.68802  ORF Transcript_30616/g.68802 Transcript_30616/m.68802 type:complete len:597 (-) Transcript_30616:125-1915(-)
MDRADLLAFRDELLRLASDEHARWTSVVDHWFAQHSGQDSVQQPNAEEVVKIQAVRPTMPPPRLMEEDPRPPTPSSFVVDFFQLSESSSSGAAYSKDSPPDSESPVEPGGVSPCSHADIQDTLQRMISPARRASVAPSTTTSLWTLVREWLRMNLNYCASALLAVNLIFMCFELELQGRAAKQLLSTDGSLSPSEMDELDPIFRVLEVTFDFVFFIELVVRAVVFGLEFFKAFSSWFDWLLVLNGLCDVILFFSGDPNTMALHVVRALSTLRAIRLLRIFRLFRGLRLLIKACNAFLPTLGWSMVLLGLCISMNGLLLGFLLQPFIREATDSPDWRLWVWTRYGTAYRAVYTVFEITFAGNWPTNTRPVLENVSNMFVIPFGLYITIITFAALRVITAVFLKDTLEAAQNDAEHQVTEKLKRKAQYVSKLEMMFKAIVDDSGNSMITEERLNALLSHPTVKAYLETLDLAVPEGTALFNILDNGDGEVTLEEFIDGILRCKGPARAIDQVALHADLRQLDTKLMRMVEVLEASSGQKVEKPKKKRKRKVANSYVQQAENLKVFHLDAETEISRIRSVVSARSGASSMNSLKNSPGF